MRFVRPAAALLALCAVAPGVARAAAWHVPGDADTIAEALTFAAAWDTIFVDAKTYAWEPAVTVSTNIQIQSNDGAPVAYPSFVVTDATLRLSGGDVHGYEYLSGETAGGLSYAEWASVLVLDGTFEATDVTVYGGYGYGILAIDSDLRLTDAAVADAYLAAGAKAVALDDDIAVTLTRTDVYDNSADGLYVGDLLPSDGHYTTLAITGSTFTGNAGVEYGGALRLYSLDVVTIDGSTTFTENSSPSAGGAISVYDTSVTIDGCTFTGNSAPLGGGSIVAYTDASTRSLTITGSWFEDGWAWDSKGTGGEIYASNVDVLLDGVHVRGSVATAAGGFLYQEGGTCSLRDSDIQGASAEAGGALAFSAVETAEVAGTELCANAASYGAAVYADAAAVSVDESVLLANAASAGAVVEVYSADLVATDDTLVGNEAPISVLYAQEGGFGLVNALFAGGAAPSATSGGTWFEAGYNLYWDTADPSVQPQTAGGDVYEDPRFAASFDRSTCGSEPWLAPGSPAADAGNPEWSDPDGSRSDIGAFPVEGTPDDTGVAPDDTGTPPDDSGSAPDDSGPVPDDSGLPDRDGDGSPDAEDCAPDDPTRSPGAWDDPFDTIDQDCDGQAATGLAHGGCGCDGAGGGGSAAIGALFSLAVRRRKRA